jgi:hypothetical protein
MYSEYLENPDVPYLDQHLTHRQRKQDKKYFSHVFMGHELALVIAIPPSQQERELHDGASSSSGGRIHDSSCKA